MSLTVYVILNIIENHLAYGSVRNSLWKVTCPKGKQVEKVACPLKVACPVICRLWGVDSPLKKRSYDSSVISMSEKLSRLNDVSSVIFHSSGLSLNKDHAHCFKTNLANPISLSVCQNISSSLDACDVPWCTRYCPYFRLTLYVSTVFFAHVGTFVQRRSCRFLLSAMQTFWIKALKSCPSGGQVTWDFNLSNCKVIRHGQVDGRLLLTLHMGI